MSYSINNGLTIKSSKEVFETILDLFADLKHDTTTYEKFCTTEEIKAFDVTRGHSFAVDQKAQAMYFTTSFDPIVPVVEKLAKLFPAVTFEYSYEMCDDEEHEMFDIYCGGVLISREDEIVTWNEEEDQHFKVTVAVSVSPQFFAWVFGLGNYVTITGPDNVVDQMKDMLDKISKRYEKIE